MHSGRALYPHHAAKRRNRPWLLLVLWPLLCGMWLSAGHDPNACLPATAQLTGVEKSAIDGEHHHHEHDNHHHADRTVSTSQQGERDAASLTIPQLETAHLEAHKECASCSLISANTSFYVSWRETSSVVRDTCRWSPLDCISFLRRHTGGFSTRGPPLVFA